MFNCTIERYDHFFILVSQVVSFSYLQSAYGILERMTDFKWGSVWGRLTYQLQCWTFAPCDAADTGAQIAAKLEEFDRDSSWPHHHQSSPTRSTKWFADTSAFSHTCGFSRFCFSLFSILFLFNLLFSTICWLAIVNIYFFTLSWFIFRLIN